MESQYVSKLSDDKIDFLGKTGIDKVKKIRGLNTNERI
jgi:hypothetical protein